MTHIVPPCLRSVSEPLVLQPKVIWCREIALVGAVAALAAAALLVGASPALADEGKKFYTVHCSSCHGVQARGNGKMAALLPGPVADLTKLSSANNGRFPTARVIRRIDGREPLESHGLPRPIWSKRLGRTGQVAVETEHGPIEADPTVVDIVAWLETLQR